MQSEKNKNNLLVLVGPTAVGKTDLSIELAKRVNGEIISADSRLLYKGMNIGTAKPTIQERRDIPHYLIDVACPDETWSVAAFQQEASLKIEAVHQKGKLPILVGGTGQYVFSILQGWTLETQKIDIKLRQVLTAWGNEIGAQELYQKLKIVDPDAASFIQYQNIRRTVRALEVILSSGEKFSKQRKKTGSPYNHLIVGLNRSRSELYQRIDQRIENMINQGLIEETKVLLTKGYTSDLPSFSAIGYREMVSVIKGEISMEEAVVLLKRMTRQFVRRQANWFKPGDPDIHWFEMDNGTIERVEHLVKDYFNK